MLHLALALTLAATYEVGPGQPLANVNDVPWESLAAGDTVLIHARPAPYAEKFVLNAAGTAAAPVTVRGVPDAQGNLPVLTGENATTRPQTNFWSETRGLIKIGGSNSPSNPLPTWVVLENLHLMKARDTFTFTGRNGLTSYDANAAAIFVESGQHVVVRGCEIEDSGNGLFASHATEDLLVEGNYLHDNGNPGSIYEHNNYTEAKGITFQYNRFGPLCTGCDGNNLKDRSSGTVIRFNWIESGNRQLDLVDSDNTEELSDPAYAQTYVYGNVLIEPDGAGNRQILHFGGDSGTTANYRGTLYFWNNTVVSTRVGRTTLMRLSSNAQSALAYGNVVYTSEAPGNLSLLDDTGQLSLAGNWLASGYVSTFNGTLGGTITDQGGNQSGIDPGFVDAAGQDFRPTAASPLRDAAPAPPAGTSAFPLDRQYLEHQQSQPRPQDGALDVGAFEFATPSTGSTGSTSAGSTAGSTASGSSTGSTSAGGTSGSGSTSAASTSAAASSSGTSSTSAASTSTSASSTSAGSTTSGSSASSAASSTGGSSTSTASASGTSGGASASAGATSGGSSASSSAAGSTSGGSTSGASAAGSTGSSGTTGSAGGKVRGGCGCNQAPGAEALLALLGLLRRRRR